MLVKTRAEWLACPADQRARLLAEHVAPLLQTYSGDVSLRYYDTEFYSARVTDIWVWDVKSHDAYQMVVEALRDTPFWDHYFEVIEILPGVEDAYAKGNDRELLTAH